MSKRTEKSKQLRGILVWYTNLCAPTAEQQWDSQDWSSNTSSLPLEVEDAVYFEHFVFSLKIKSLADKTNLASQGITGKPAENYAVQTAAAIAITKVICTSFLIPSLRLRQATLYYVSKMLVDLAINPSTPIKTAVASLTALVDLVRDDDLAAALQAAAKELEVTENRDISFLFSPGLAHTREGLGVLHSVNSEVGCSDLFAEVELPTRSDYIQTAWEDGF